MNVQFRHSFSKDLRKIRKKTLLLQIQALIEQVECAESMREISNVKQLTADGPYYRIRIGDYRIGITVEKDTVTFVRCLHRRDIYRYFP